MLDRKIRAPKTFRSWNPFTAPLLDFLAVLYAKPGNGPLDWIDRAVKDRLFPCSEGNRIRHRIRPYLLQAA
jgi:hypothetical protein